MFRLMLCLCVWQSLGNGESATVDLFGASAVSTRMRTAGESTTLCRCRENLCRAGETRARKIEMPATMRSTLVTCGWTAASTAAQGVRGSASTASHDVPRKSAEPLFHRLLSRLRQSSMSEIGSDRHHNTCHHICVKDSHACSVVNACRGISSLFPSPLPPSVEAPAGRRAKHRHHFLARAFSLAEV